MQSAFCWLMSGGAVRCCFVSCLRRGLDIAALALPLEKVEGQVMVDDGKRKYGASAERGRVPQGKSWQEFPSLYK